MQLSGKGKALISVLFGIGSVLALWTCFSSDGKDIDSGAGGAAAGKVDYSADARTSDENVRAIALPHDTPDFPSAPGRELFIERCTVCHTLRYITMQPNFPHKVWVKEVDKMITTFSAHISKEEAKQIVDYLDSVKGVKSAGK